MKKTLSLAAAALLACALPSAASAQCEDGCTRIIRDGLQTGWGCEYMEGSGLSCISTRTLCNLQRCMNAYLTTPEGRFVAMQSTCAEEESSTASALRAAGERIAASFARPEPTLALARPRADAATD